MLTDPPERACSVRSGNMGCGPRRAARIMSGRLRWQRE